MNRSTLTMLILFIILGIAVIIVEKPFSEPEPVEKSNPDLGPMFPDFDRDSVVKMSFSSFGGTTVLEKKDGKWFVLDDDKDYPADPEAVDKVFETVEKMEAEEVISRNPSKHIQFQVNSPQDTETEDESGNKKPFHMGTLGTEVVMYDADDHEIVHFYVGKNGTADFMTTYVRKDGSDTVVLVDGYLKAVFGKGSPKNWKDRLLCKIEPDEIDKITLGEGENAIVLVAQKPEDTDTDKTEVTSHPKRSDITWKMISPREGEIVKRQGDRISGMFRRFLASDYAPELDDPQKYGFDHPSATVAVDLKDGSHIKFIIGSESEKKKNNYYIKKEGDDRIFIIPKYRVEQLQRKPDDFFKETDSNVFNPTHVKPPKSKKSTSKKKHK